MTGMVLQNKTGFAPYNLSYFLIFLSALVAKVNYVIDSPYIIINLSQTHACNNDYHLIYGQMSNHLN